MFVIIICISKYSFRHQGWIMKNFNNYEFKSCRHFQNLIEKKNPLHPNTAQ